MTLLSLFMTSTGVFCFVPISYRLVESGIIPASNASDWLPFVHTPTFVYYARRKGGPLLLAAASDAEEAGNIWSDVKHHYHHHNQARSYLEDSARLVDVDDTVIIDRQRPAMPHADVFNAHIVADKMVSPLRHSAPATPCLSRPETPSIDIFYGHKSMSFASLSDCTLCDDCDTLLRSEIPADHIPSVVRALALFEAQDRLSLSASASTSDITNHLDESEIIALANAFSTLQL